MPQSNERVPGILSRIYAIRRTRTCICSGSESAVQALSIRKFCIGLLFRLFLLSSLCSNFEEKSSLTFIDDKSYQMRLRIITHLVICNQIAGAGSSMDTCNRPATSHRILKFRHINSGDKCFIAINIIMYIVSQTNIYALFILINENLYLLRRTNRMNSMRFGKKIRQNYIIYCVNIIKTAIYI